MIADMLDDIAGILFWLGPDGIVCWMIIIIALLIMAAIVALVWIEDRRRIRIIHDPMQDSFGDVPGVTAEQLRQYSRAPAPPVAARSPSHGRRRS